MKKAFLLLSGCGVKDGSEIHESVLCLLALDKLGINVQCIAPDVEQNRTINHFTQTPESTSRNALVEGARIARGNILPLTKANVEEADMLVIPGGLGAATTLCTYAADREKATVLPEVKTIVLSFFENKKPIVATCIAPAILALCLRDRANVTLTLGTNPSDIAWLNEMGMHGSACHSDSFVYDKTYKIATTPAYMEQTTIAKISKGIENAIIAASE